MNRGALQLPQSITKRIVREHRDVFGDDLKLDWDRQKPDEERDGSVILHALSNEQLGVLESIAETTNNKRLAKICHAIVYYDSTHVPSFEAFHAMLQRWLCKYVTTGWFYRQDDNGLVYPYAIEKIERHDPSGRDRDDKPWVRLQMAYRDTSVDYGRSSRYGGRDIGERSVIFQAGDVSRRNIGTIMEREGLLLETPELRAQYDAQIAHLHEVIMGNYGKQYRLDRKSEAVPGRRCLMVTRDKYIHNVTDLTTMSHFVQEDDEWGGPVPTPLHTNVQAFDLEGHNFSTVHATRLTPYVYRPELANKLILPESHMDMLDVLTTNTDALMSDIIEGKSAGNIILCKGIPGIGKTLTAEVYSEIVGKAIYNVHSGTLGTRPDEVEKSLSTIFERVTKWDCILLLDEADVFVAERGADLVQNAIVAVFLRTLEYFPGLMFMTTNRSDNIDDAIISRCAAIIDYGVPSRDDAFAIWKVLSEQQDLEFDDDLVTACIDAFPTATPRDVKQLIRLAGRVARSNDEPVTEDLLRKVAQFRAVEIKPKKNAAEVKAVKVRRRKRPGT